MNPSPSRRRAAAGNLLFNYAGLVLSVIKNIALVPLYLHFFDLSTYGAWLATGNVLGILGFVDGGFGVVLSQRLASSWGGGDRSRFAAVAGAGIVWSGAMALLLVAAALAIAGRLPGWMNAPASSHAGLTTAFVLAACGAALTLLQANLFAVPYAWQRTSVPGWCRLLAQTTELAVTFGALIAGTGVVSLGLGLFVGGAVGLAAGIVVTIRMWTRLHVPLPRGTRAEFRELLTLTTPNLLGKMGSAILGNSEATFTAALLNPAASAVLVLTGRGMKLAESLVNPVAGSMFYGLAHLTGEARGPRVLSVVRDVTVLSAGVAAVTIPLALVLDQPFVNLWVGADRFGGLPLATLIAFNSILLTRANLLGMILPALGELRSIAWCPVAEVALRIPLLLFLLPRIGIAAVPIGSIASTVIVSLIFYSLRLHHALGIDFRSAARLQTVGGLALGGSFLLAYLIAATVSPAAHTIGELIGVGLGSGVAIVGLVSILSPAARNVLSSFLFRRSAPAGAALGQSL
jgi:O-antigen/teichoic acid export membrane protein